MTAPNPPRKRRAGRSITAPRQAAVAILAALRRGELLDPAFERYAAPLEHRERRWLRELVYGMLRRREWLDAVLLARVKGGFDRIDPDVLDLLRIGSYQLLHMGSVPNYAAIAQTVELAKLSAGRGAAGLVNAVLRRVDRERDSLGVPVPEDPMERLALEESHPEWLIRRWVERFGIVATAELVRANNREAQLILRPYGVDAETLERSLIVDGVATAPAALGTGGLEVTGGIEGSLTELGSFRRGEFHVQDPASTLVTQFADIAVGTVVADLCAAPGGKAVELSRRARMVVATDISPTRIERVAENVARLRLEHVHAVVADARRPALGEVDAVLIDVPCTGTGTFRRHPDARWRLKVADIAVMAALQREILRSAAELVRPGGLLVYSTCSIEPEENDDQIDRFLEGHSGWAEELPREGAVNADVVDGQRLRVLPHRHGTDGAFAARLRRAAA